MFSGRDSACSCCQTGVGRPGAGRFRGASASPGRATPGCRADQRHPSCSCRWSGSRRTQVPANRTACPCRRAGPATLVHRDAVGTSAPAVLRGCTPVRRTPAARAWSPGPSPSAAPFRCPRPERTRVLCGTARAASSPAWSNPAPVAAGVDEIDPIPLGTDANASRTRRVGHVAARANAGVIASSIAAR